MNEVDQIELRSDKVRKMIGDVPSGIVRYSISIMAIIVIGLLTVINFISYPQTLDVEAIAGEDSEVILLIPYKYINIINAGMSISIEFEGYVADIYGYQRGAIDRLSEDIQSISGTNYFEAKTAAVTGNYKVKKKMKGTASILISNRTIFQRLFRYKN